MDKEIKYNEAMLELTQIVNEIENGEISIDELSLKIKRASELLKFCKAKLKSTELDVSAILKEMEE